MMEIEEVSLELERIIKNDDVAAYARLSKEMIDGKLVGEYLISGEDDISFNFIESIISGRKANLFEYLKNGANEIDIGVVEEIIWIEAYGSIDVYHKGEVSINPFTFFNIDGDGRFTIDEKGNEELSPDDFGDVIGEVDHFIEDNLPSGYICIREYKDLLGRLFPDIF